MSVIVEVEKLPPKASNFERTALIQYRLTINKCSPLCPLKNVHCKKFCSTVLPLKHVQFMEDIKNLEIYRDDIWVITFPKCGTTWAQEAIWQIYNGVDLDSEKSKESLRTRFPFMEFASLIPDQSKNWIDQVRNSPRPRFIKSHLPICFLPENLWTTARKIIYVAREPKDVAVSYFHHYSNLRTYKGTSEEFFELFLDGMVEDGCYWTHLEQFSFIRHLRNFKFIKFEDMKRDLKGVLVDLAKFLKKDLSEEQIERLLKHLSFNSMRNNPAVNYSLMADASHDDDRDERCKKTGFNFIRKGESQCFKDEMSPEFVQRFDEKTNEIFGSYEDL
ncbi:luciferin sulfotransferase-like [Culicoides brevitarsis]|uniref:luciferin sulfotransferase-like n=1 Tax=Culicoides brevitarsis TaxID=469753 RepID=UPI00307B7427